MWINTVETVLFKKRCAIAIVTREMFLDAGIPLEDLRLFAKFPEFNEDIVRNALLQKYKGVANWQLHLVTYRWETNTLEVVVSSPDMPEVDDGMNLPSV